MKYMFPFILCACSASSLKAADINDLQKIVALQQAKLQAIESALNEMILLTEKAECPPGWKEYEKAKGRFLLGRPNDGTAGSTQGTPLNAQSRLVLKDVPAHSHMVDPPPTYTANAGEHSHGTGDALRKYFWVAYDSKGDGAVGKGNGGGWDGHNVLRTETSTNGSHSHSVDIAPFSSETTGVQNGVDITPPLVTLRFCTLR